MSKASFIRVLSDLFGYASQHPTLLLILTLMALVTASAGFITVLYLIRKYREKKWGWCGCQKDMSGKVIIITGANSGIGLDTAQALASAGAVVIVACRSSANASQAISEIRKTTNNGELIFIELDLSSFASVKRFASQFIHKFNRLDVLINNAGVFHPPQVPPMTDDKGVEIHFSINHLGHFLLTKLLTDTIVATANSRILVVSSELYKHAALRLDDLTLIHGAPPKSRNPLYSNSKLANILHARELNIRLKPKGVTVCSISPGFVYTNLMRHSLHQFGWLKKVAFLPIAFFFMRSRVQGAQTSIHCAMSAKVAPYGAYYQNCAVAPLLPLATDDRLAKELWTVSEQMVAE